MLAGHDRLRDTAEHIARMTILGINAYHGDAAAAAVRDGTVVGAVAEERFTRRKHEGGLPRHAIQWCLDVLGGPPDIVAIGRDPRAHAGRKFRALLRYPGLLAHVPERTRNRQDLGRLPKDFRALLGHDVPVTFVEHHRAHLTHAYITSPFHRCALLSLDGFGDFVSTAWGKGVAGKVTIGRRVFFPHSLGIFYTAITQFLGFDRYGEEYKVMALAPYGTPRYQHLLRELIVPTPRGFRLTPAYFEHTGRGVSMSFGEGVPSLGRVYRPRLTALLGPAKERDDPLTERHADLAASLQAVTETIVLSIARLVRDETREVCLAVAGGVALNSVANGVMRRSGLFRDIWIPSAPADDGTAIGAAAAVALKYGEGYPPHRENATPFLGPAYPAHHALRHRAGEEMRSIMERMVAALTRGEIVAWFRGRMEFGPRALGHRSIFADPRRADLRTVLNSRVKHREAFRPFAPIVLEEDAATYFELQGSSPNMMFVFPVRPPWRERLPAITHVDGSARVQTISPDLDPTLATLLTLWRERTGISVLLNTSFNENEPIVCTPKEAVACFQRTRMDVLVLEHALREKQALHSSCSCYTHGTPCG